MGQVSRAAIDAWKNEHVFPFHVYVVHAVRYAMEDIEQLASFQILKKPLISIFVWANFGITKKANLCFKGLYSFVLLFHAEAGWRVDWSLVTSMNM